MKYLNYYSSLFFLIVTSLLSSCRKYECPDVAHTVNLSNGITDVQLTTLNPNTPNGGIYGVNAALGWTQGGIPFRTRVVFKFDYSQIPSGAVIKSAVLTLYADTIHLGNIKGHNSDGLTGPNEWLIQKVTSPWDPITVAWDTQPSSTTLDQITLPASTSSNGNAIVSSSLSYAPPTVIPTTIPIKPNLPPSKTTMYVVDVTNLIKDEFENPSSANGFMMKLVNEKPYNSIVFASTEHPDSTLHPKLEIEYNIND